MKRIGAKPSGPRAAPSTPAKEPEKRPSGETQRGSNTGEARERSALAQEFQRSLSRIAEASREQRQRLAEGSRRTLQAAASRIRRLGSFADQLDAQREAEAKAQAEAEGKEQIFGRQRRNIEETLKHRPPADKQERTRLKDYLRDEDKRRGQTREPPSPTQPERPKSAREMLDQFDRAADLGADNKPPSPARSKDNAKDQDRQSDHDRDRSRDDDFDIGR